MRTTLRLLAVAVSLAVVSAVPAWAQITAPTATKNVGNSADEFQDGLTLSFQRTTTASILSNTGFILKARYAEVVGTDTGILTGRTEDLSVDYTIGFNVTAPVGYLLTITSSLNGALTLVNDGNGTATASTGPVTGTATPGLSSGSDDLGGTTSLSTSSGGNTPFARTALGTITGLSNGLPVAHTLRFTWASRCQSSAGSISGGDECAVRLGIPISYSGETAGDYPGSGGRTQSSDGHFVTVNFQSLCGNGVINAPEQCDEGANNGLGTSCCTSTCTFRTAGSVCRASAGDCDIAEVCTGGSGACPLVDAFQPNSVICRAAIFECDLQENCTGVGPTCPADAKKPLGTACTSDGNPCTLDQCDGSSVFCTHPAGNLGALCRAAAGICDVAEFCDGVNTACPPNAKEPAGTVCRAAAGVCDIQEECDGVGNFCPPDSVSGSFVVCRSSAGVCDPAENCTGTGVDCPADSLSGALVVCRSSAGQCDLTENCTGFDVDCPVDAKSVALCRASAGVCDIDEFCDGINNDCPADVFVTGGTVCRSSTGFCDPQETCTGSTAPCPSDAFLPSSTVCRSSDGVCDPAENCTGSSGPCPPDLQSPNGTVCRSAAGVCDVQEVCSGVSDDCPADSVTPAFVVCRSDAGQCDIEEQCDGVGVNCPPDAFEPDGLPCDDLNACSVPDTCQAGQCIGTPDPDACLDDFTCYKDKKLGTQTVYQGVTLADIFETRVFDVEVRKHLCTPTNKNDEGLLDGDTHMRDYLIRPAHAQAPFVKVLGKNVSNQLGALKIDIVRRYTLLVPTTKGLLATPPAPNPLAPNYEHFKCYKMRVSKGTPVFAQTTVSVTDQFTTNNVFTVVKPKRFCTPVDKNGEGIVNGSRHLLCYKVRAASPIVTPATVFSNNQFGPETVGMGKVDEMCIPTVLLP